MKKDQLFHLLRPVNLLAILLIQSCCFFIGGQGIGIDFVLYILTPTLFTAAAGYIINGYFDRVRDVVNGKPALKSKGLLTAYFGLNIAALALAFTDNATLFLAVLAIQAALFLYSYILSGWPLIGNLVVAFISCMVVFIFHFSDTVGLDIQNLWVFLVSIFLVSLCREMIKDIEDIEGDRDSGAYTMPIIWGVKMSHVFADLLLIGNAFFILSWSYYDFYLENNTAFWIGVFLSLFGIAIVFWSHLSKKSKKYKMMSRLLKVYMFLGLMILPFLSDV